MAKQESMLTGTEPLPDGTLARISGEIDYSRSTQLRGDILAIVKAAPKRLVLDLSGVPYMDSSGVAMLVETHKAQRTHGGKLVLCCLQPKVKGIFEIARLNTVFTIVDDAGSAAKA